MSFDHIMGKGKTEQEARTDLHNRVQDAMSTGLLFQEEGKSFQVDGEWRICALLSPPKEVVPSGTKGIDKPTETVVE